METTSTALSEALQPKTRLTGKVIKTTIAGAVLDIGQRIPGVIHISQLSREPVNRVEDILQEGQTVEVWVRRVHSDRVELTMIEPPRLEWREIQPEMIVHGKVTRLETYGAFVDIGATRPALVHVSEISHGFIKNPAEALKVGDEVEAKVLEVDRRKKQIRLSMKAVAAQEEEEAEVTKPKPRKEKGSGKNKKAEKKAEEPVEEEPELTAFQIAFQKAQERAGGDMAGRAKKSKTVVSPKAEEIFDRTLKNRLPTG